jgi:hypothetical protein
MYRPITTNQNLNRPTFIPELLENVGTDQLNAKNKYQSIEVVDRDTFSILKYGIARDLQHIDFDTARKVQSEADRDQDPSKLDLARKAQSAAAHHERVQLQQKEAQTFNVDLETIDIKQARLIQSESDRHPGSELKASHLKEKAQISCFKTRERNSEN